MELPARKIAGKTEVKMEILVLHDSTSCGKHHRLVWEEFYIRGET